MTPQQKAVLHFFDEYVFGFMRSDITAAIRGNANYLAALGLVTYTEILGGFRTGKLGVVGQSAGNFNAFLPYLGNDYLDLRTRGVDLYDRLRCGLVHQYFIKGEASIWMQAEGPCGVISSPDGPTYLFVNVYSKDLFAGAARYRNDILDGADSSLASNFETSIRQIELPFP